MMVQLFLDCVDRATASSTAFVTFREQPMHFKDKQTLSLRLVDPIADDGVWAIIDDGCNSAAQKGNYFQWRWNEHEKRKVENSHGHTLFLRSNSRKSVSSVHQQKRGPHLGTQSGAPRFKWRHSCITSCAAGVSPPAAGPTKVQQRASERQRRTRSHPTWPAKHTPLSAGGWVALVWLLLRPTSARNSTFPQTNGRRREHDQAGPRLDPPALGNRYFRRLALTNATPSR